MSPLVPSQLAAYKGRLGNPGQRATIPDAYLQKLAPALYQRRLSNVQNKQRTTQENKAYDPMALLNGSQIAGLARLLSGGEFDPQITAAQDERKLTIANYAALGERLAGYHKMQAGALATAHEQAQTGADALATKLADTTKNTLGSLDAGAEKSQQFARDDAALRGGDVSGGMAERLTADFQKQRAGVASNLSAQEDAGNVAGQGWAGLVGMMQGAEAIRGEDAQSQVGIMGANATSKIDTTITGLRAQKGVQTVKNITDLRKSEFEKQVTAQTLTLKGQAADAAAKKTTWDQKYKDKVFDATQKYRQAAIDLRTLTQQQAHGDRTDALNQRIKDAQTKNDQAKQRLDIAQGNLDVARQRLTQSNKPGEVKGQWLPPVSMAHAISDFHRLQGDPILRKMKQDGKTRQEAADAILGSKKWGHIDASLISAALDMVYGTGRISVGTAQRLRDAKIQAEKLGVPINTPPKKQGVKLNNRSGSSGTAGGDPTGRYK
jgi:hypothetical protein